MIRFFRAIRQNLLSQNRFTRYLVYAHTISDLCDSTNLG